GCDKACTYCIVPKTRGQEISRPAEEILIEIDAFAVSGYQEVTLLGQNVNSNGKRFPDGSGYKGPLGRLRLLEEDPASLLDFPQLLRLIDQSFGRVTPEGRPPPPGADDARRLRRGEDGGVPQAAGPAPRIRFTTSHPFDANVRLFEAMRDCPSVCECLHLPVQSGSNRLLRAMRRGYTREAYLDKITQLRRLIPDISLSTDVIVGFPGERDDDFQQTASLMREVEYDNAYIFKYSPRPGTDAAAREDDVPREVKEERNQALLALQDEISLKRHRRFEGRTVEVLIEGPGKRPGQLFGRTRGDHGVILQGSAEWIGQMLPVRITQATAHTLFGERCRDSSR
ncbi:MAG: radical SAM protein, partial [Candidatus Omnitrophica bacterium]|nr:radical SAM protein [Candidatus Omnitrophota bacterium]